MSYLSMVFYTSTGAEETVAVTFPYLDVTHVNISFWNPVTEVYDLQDPGTWSWATTASITLTNADTSTDGIKVWRATGTTPLVTFTNASLLNEDDQNKAALQAVYLIEEGIDYAVYGFVAVDAQIAASQTLALTYEIGTVGGAEITAGTYGSLYIPFSCTIVSAVATGDVAGTCEIDIWKDSLANHPPTIADTIVASAPIVITTDTQSIDSTLTGWTTVIPAGSTLTFVVNSIDTFTRLTIAIIATK